MSKQFILENLKKLELYVPVVARVHGNEHPEFHQVHRLFNIIDEKIKKNESVKNEFLELRQITANYTVPSDVCESYEAVYQMLSEIDQAYQV